MPSEKSSRKDSGSQPPKKKAKKKTTDSPSKNDGGRFPLSKETVTASDGEESEGLQDDRLESTSPRTTVAPEQGRKKPSYAPPPGFRPLPKSSSSTANPFSPQNLENKKLFIFTAPSTAKLSEIATRLPLQPGPDGGDIVLKHANGRKSYTVRREEEDAPNLNILVPSQDGKNYLRSRHKISAHFTISEAPPLTKISSYGFNKAASSATAARPQPSGLRMRFQPSGWGNDTVSEEQGYGLDDEPDVDGDDGYTNGATSLRLAGENRENSPTHTKKHKSKYHHRHQDHERSVRVESPEHRRSSVLGTPGKRAKSNEHEGESPEERKAHREAKRLKKEKKKKRAEG